MKKQKKSRRSLKYTVGGIVALSICTAIIYPIYKKNTSNFLSTLKKSETTKSLLAQAWPDLSSKAKTSLHYLMLLKRLHAYDLHKPYENVLIRALWKYKNVSSIVALGADYFLQQYSIENNRIILTNAHSSVVQKELKKFLDNTIDILWERYPHMVRLYYISTTFEFENNIFYSQAFSGDELLDLYRKLYSHHTSWQDYKTLWKLTDEHAFLYLFVVYAQQAKETAIAEDAYNTFLKTYTPSYAPQHATMMSYLALIMRNTSLLLSIAEHEKSEEALLNLASTYIYTGKQDQAWNVLEKYNKVIQSHSEMWDSVYFWLASRKAELSYGEISALFQKLYKKHPNLLSLVYEYWVFFYKKDTSNKKNMHALDTSLFPNGFFTSPKVVFLETEKKHKGSLQPSLTALWRAYNTHEDLQLWKHILASYFLRYALYDEFSILQEKHTHDIEMLPYEFFFTAKKKNTPMNNVVVNRLTDATKDGNALGNTQYDFSWWHYYNMAVQYNAKMDYENAQSALQKAEFLYRTSYHSNEYQYMPYIWIQYAYAARGKNDAVSTQTFVNKIRNVAPTFVYLQKFENY